MGRTVRVDGGRIFTGTRYVEALLIDDGRVAAAGAAATVGREAPTGSEHVDLHGHLVLPGLLDAHLHLPDLTDAREGLDLASARSIPELLDLVRAWAVRRPAGPITGRGWSADRLLERREPVATDLDRAVADRPVYLRHASGHAAVVNRAALDALGVERATPDPPGGRFGRDADASPDGRVYETALRRFEPLAQAALAVTPEGLERTLDACVGLGITGVATLNLAPEGAALLTALDRAGRLSIPVWGYAALARETEFPARAPDGPGGSPRFRMIGGKAFLDGAFGPRTAWLSSPYADAPGEIGLSTAPDAELAEQLDAAAERGWAPALHAIGDRAVEAAARHLERFRTEGGARPRLEHAALVPPELLPALDRSRPALVVQPGFVWSDHWLPARLGPERARWAYPFRTLQDRGHLLVGSSDAPYDPVDPWRGLSAAVERRDPDGRSANPTPEEALSAEEALRLYGAHAGIALGESPRGTLEPGAPADLVFVRARRAADAIRDGAAGVRATWVGGRPMAPRRAGARPQTP